MPYRSGNVPPRLKIVSVIAPLAPELLATDGAASPLDALASAVVGEGGAVAPPPEQATTKRNASDSGPKTMVGMLKFIAE